MKQYKTGFLTYTLPDQACVFCANCFAVVNNYHGAIGSIYCKGCYPASDFGNVPTVCKHFKEQQVENFF